jgi:general secretion pathway protein G
MPTFINLEDSLVRRFSDTCQHGRVAQPRLGCSPQASPAGRCTAGREKQAMNTRKESSMLQQFSKKRGDGGFTLIELLVVIVILGILAAVVVFAVGGIQDRGNDSACKSDTASLRTAEEAYYASKDAGNGKYGTMSDLEGKFIAKASEYHTITLGTGGASYTIGNVTGKCSDA